MRITRISPWSGQRNIMEIDVTQDQLDEWRNGKLIQHAMPHLSAEEREFILTGYTPEDWDAIFGKKC